LDPDFTSSMMAWVRLTDESLSTDLWFKLYVEDPSYNTVTVPNNDGTELESVKFQ